MTKRPFQELTKEIFRIRFLAIELPKNEGKPAAQYLDPDKLLVRLLAKNRLLNDRSKKELRGENWGF